MCSILRHPYKPLSPLLAHFPCGWVGVQKFLHICPIFLCGLTPIVNEKKCSKKVTFGKVVLSVIAIFCI